MFTDRRSKRVLFVAHCILNQNAISDGTADYPGSIKEVVSLLTDQHVGIVQMPCPELCCLGLDRGDPAGVTRPIVEENTRIRAAMQSASATDRLTIVAQHLVWQILEYRKHGFTVHGIVGINRSPSCGVETTSIDNQETAGRGVFIAAIDAALSDRGFAIPTIGIKALELPRAVQRIGDLIRMPSRI